MFEQKSYFFIAKVTCIDLSVLTVLFHFRVQAYLKFILHNYLRQFQMLLLDEVSKKYFFEIKTVQYISILKKKHTI